MVTVRVRCLRGAILLGVSSFRGTVAAMTFVVALWALFFAFTGGALSSFSAVAAQRLPRGQSLGGRSMCACGRQLRWFENVPVLGWLRVRGRARCCGVVIPANMVVCEALCAASGAVFGATVAASVLLDVWLGFAVLAGCVFVAALLGCGVFQFLRADG